MSSSFSPPPPADRPRKRHGWFALAVWSAMSAAAYALYSGALVLPDRFNPWAPLEVTAPPNFLTDYKLSRARSDPARCLKALAQTPWVYDLLPDRVTGPGCGFENAVRLREAGIRMGTALSLSCPMALSFFMWEQHALQPAAQQHVGQRVVAIDHLGSYACRNVNRDEGVATKKGMSPGLRSRHATANALDIAGLTLASGQRITVLKDWRRADATAPPDPQSQLLAEAHQGACRFFNGVLGPDYNAMHRDHFHFELRGPCRLDGNLCPTGSGGRGDRFRCPLLRSEAGRGAEGFRLGRG